jgi:fatty acid desaturase
LHRFIIHFTIKSYRRFEITIKVNFILRFLSFSQHNQEFFWDDLLTFTLPLAMFLFGTFNLIIVLKIWFSVVAVASVSYMVVALNAGHHGTTIFHDGDELKSLDFGFLQLASTIDRKESKKSHFLVLTSFGNHILHHLFPTLDHVLLPQLKGILIETCKEFELVFREMNVWELFVGQFQQLAKTEKILVTNKTK